MKPNKWIDSSQPSVVQKDLGTAASSSNTKAGGNSRRLLQLQAAGTHHALLQKQRQYQQYQQDAAVAPHGALSNSRRLMQQQNKTSQQQQQQNSTGTQTSSQTLTSLGFPGFSGLTPVWVIYTQLDPLNVTALLSSLSQACGGVPWKGGQDVASQPCGIATAKALRRSGLSVDDAKYQQMIIGKPVVSFALQGLGFWLL
jgi:hypothetical protein